MKKFEVGKCYENRAIRSIGNSTIEVWQCTKIKNNKATFNLAKFFIAKAGTEDFKEEKNIMPRKYLCRVSPYVIGDCETAYNKSQFFYITANDEVKED